jgi:starch phosphorylase
MRNRYTPIPFRISGLPDLSGNLWGSWHSEARILGNQVNQKEWKASIHNPVRMLRDFPAGFIEVTEKNAGYLRRCDISMNRSRRYLNTRTGWCW